MKPKEQGWCKVPEDPRRAELEKAAGEERRLIDPEEWHRAKFAWMESVRRDPSLNDRAKLVAHSLALDFANSLTQRCDPSFREIGKLLGKSEDTVKRAIADLVADRWIVRLVGRHRGLKSGYGFLTSAKVVQIRGGRKVPVYGPERGADLHPFNGPKGGQDCTPNRDLERGADLRGKGGKSAPAYNKDKSWKNHGARTGAHAGAPTQARVRGLSDNPMVIADAKRAVVRFREGRSDAIASLQPWVRDYIIAADLLTPEEREAAGLS